MTGVHIVFEGPDAVGKSTQILRTKQYCQDLGHNVTLTREPGGTQLGAMLRSIVLDTDLDIHPRAEALIMAADRVQDIEEIIKPALDRGEVVLSDRFVPSSLVYQGVLRGLGVETIRDLNKFVVQDHRPDCIVCFDLEDSIARERASNDPDRIEKEGDIFQQRIRDTYRQLSDKFHWSIIDANGSEGEVFSRIVDVITPIVDRVKV